MNITPPPQHPSPTLTLVTKAPLTSQFFRFGALFVAGSLLALTGVAQPAAATSPTPNDAPRPRREVTWNNVPTTPHPLVTHHELHSHAMQRTVGYTVYLPPNYTKDTTSRHPVLYFLHGAGGDENADGPGFAGIVDRLIKAGQLPPVICVFPNGGMSGYRDNPETGINVESMILKELIPLIDATYRTDARREARVIGGFSMGGGGAIRLAVTNPHLFSAAASWAGTVVNRRTGELPAGFEIETLRDQNPTVNLLLIVGYDDEISAAGHYPLIERLREAKYPVSFQTLRNVPHNLGLYYEQTGEVFARFLLSGIKPEKRP